jgi:hypothetical protein
MSKSRWAFRPAVLTRATKAAEKKAARVRRKWSATCGFRPTLIYIKECREKLLSISNTRGWWRRSSKYEKVESLWDNCRRCALLRSTTLASLVNDEIAVVVS